MCGPAADLILDDGTTENAATVGGEPYLWLNRFTPSAFPFEIDSVSTVFDQFSQIGDPIQVVLWEDTDGDGNPGTGAVLRHTEVFAVVANDESWNVFTLASPVRFLAGDILVGLVNRSGGLCWARRDESSDARRSWMGAYTGGAPDPPTLPADDIWGPIHWVLEPSVSVPGNWMIRAHGHQCSDPTGYVVHAEGFVTSGPWQGYASPYADASGSSIVPDSFLPTREGFPLCVDGTVAQTAAPNGYAGIHVTLNQELDAGVVGTWVPGDTLGVRIGIGQFSDNDFRIQISGPGANPQRWCYMLRDLPLHSSTRTVAWSDFTTECWAGSGTSYAGEELASLEVQVEGAATDVDYDFCLDFVEPLLP